MVHEGEIVPEPKDKGQQAIQHGLFAQAASPALPGQGQKQGHAQQNNYAGVFANKNEVFHSATL